MIIKNNKAYNLWDTNGRRNDILNAINIYLHILCDIKENYPTEEWKPYPESLAQFLFYQKAIEASPEVFSTHNRYDEFLEKLGEAEENLLLKDQSWIEGTHFQDGLKESLDKDIEQRSRHYTSNLVKIGFTDQNRNITSAGLSFLKGSVRRDNIEELLPIDDTNLILLRQLLKLRLFSTKREDGTRTFCSPVLMALYALLNSENIDKEDFISLVQGINPYFNSQTISIINSGEWSIEKLIGSIASVDEKIPEPFLSDEFLDYGTYTSFIKNRKSTANSADVYYGFYTALYNFRQSQTEEHYEILLKHLQENKEMLNKAFGYGKRIFDIGKIKRYDLAAFLEKNKQHILLSTMHFNAELYNVYAKSKFIDSSREYSDTTIRLLGATGIFKFKPLPELAYKEAFREIFSNSILASQIFGEMTEAEFIQYEVEKNGTFRTSTTLAEILNLTDTQIEEIASNLCEKYNVHNKIDLKNRLSSKVFDDFKNYIEECYPIERVVSLLGLFSNRANDKTIQREVNESATVPTIYEYIVAIAWYYISDKSFNLYQSLNLTLNADFEPVVHAGGGAGDIVITSPERIVMLEVTLMNKQAQKRGEWEPVLRHSLNLKAENKEKETLTFFIADELDFNTINIWRAVAAVPLESTNSHDKVDGVVIMPFTNLELITFLNENVNSDTIINESIESFKEIPKITDTQWREKVMDKLTAK